MRLVKVLALLSFLCLVMMGVFYFLEVQKEKRVFSERESATIQLQQSDLDAKTAQSLTAFTLQKSASLLEIGHSKNFILLLSKLFTAALFVLMILLRLGGFPRLKRTANP